MLPTINDAHANFILAYTDNDGNGLGSIVRNLDLNDDESMLIADIQPDLIQAFSNEFPDTDLKELDNAVQWILITSIAKMKDN